jgi:hypothetical protein
MLIEYIMTRKYGSIERRIYHVITGSLPTWADCRRVSTFSKRYNAGNGVFEVGNNFVRKVSDMNNFRS